MGNDAPVNKLSATKSRNMMFDTNGSLNFLSNTIFSRTLLAKYGLDGYPYVTVVRRYSLLNQKNYSSREFVENLDVSFLEYQRFIAKACIQNINVIQNNAY